MNETLAIRTRIRTPVRAVGQVSALALAASACAACASGPSRAVPAFHGPPPTAYVERILDDIATHRGGMRRVRALGIGLPEKAALRGSILDDSFFGYRVCVAYDAKYRFGGFQGRRTYVYWFYGNNLHYVTRDPAGECGIVAPGLPPQPAPGDLGPEVAI